VGGAGIPRSLNEAQRCKSLEIAFGGKSVAY
jgi:hypothetical protein